jgi:aspartate carbamoyltransferase catalytic subunit
MISSYWRVDDLTDEQVDDVLDRAAMWMTGDADAHVSQRVLGLIFLEESLRTRIGFQVAAARLGWRWVEVTGRRDGPTTSSESVADTLRTVAGYTQALVIRPGVSVDRDDLQHLTIPVVNAGDRGPSAEHPTQALIDVFAIQQLVGPLKELHVAICGDPSMRAARSLLALLARRPPRHLSVVCASSHRSELKLPAQLDGRVTFVTLAELSGIDVLYAAGMPHQSLPLEARERLLVDRSTLASLTARGVVLSPMPVIDEVQADARDDPRVQFFAQSDLGLHVRTAILERVVSQGIHGASWGREHEDQET